ncbi:MAG: hypothetical protein ACOCV3_07835 [Halanaerobiales bacterium]
MTEVTIFRIISLFVLMIVVAVAWYYYKFSQIEDTKKSDEEKNKEMIKQQAIKISVIIGFIYMVLVLGLG